MAQSRFNAVPYSSRSGRHGSAPSKAAADRGGHVLKENSSPTALLVQARILSLLHEIGKELTSILDLEALLRAVGERVKELVDYDLFNVMLLDSETRRLEHAFSLHYDRRIHLRRTLAMGEGLCGSSALERKPIRVNQVGDDPRYIRCEAGLNVESELVVPLIIQDRLLGVLDLESLRPGAFTEDHEQVLVTLASTVAIALENARLYDQLRRAEQRKKEDLERAREVQKFLLPSRTPDIPGLDIAVLYQPAQELGGDFYDFLPYPGGRTAVAVGDVAGKGSAAALLATLGVGILREHAVHSPSQPAEMLADLNGHLLVPGSNGRFIALAFCVYDPVQKDLIIANAGFPLPLLLRDRRATPIDVGGVPLGLLPESTYESVRVQLQAGDIVVLCSDGIHEQTNALEEQFGVERLLSQLAETGGCATAARVAENIARSIDEHAGSGTGDCSFIDDRTIVILKVKGAACDEDCLDGSSINPVETSSDLKGSQSPSVAAGGDSVAGRLNQ